MSTKLKPIIGSLILVAGLVAVGVFVWAATNPAGTAKDPASSSKASKLADCKISDLNICKMLEATSRHESYIIRTTATAEGVTSTTDFYIASPDLTRVITKSAGSSMEMIITADATYTKTDSGPWSKQTLSSEEIAKRKAERERKEIINSVSGTNKDMTYEPLGKKPCGAMTCYAYTMIDATEPDMKTETLFDDKDFLPRQSVITMENTSTVMTYEYKKVTISVPSI